MPRCRFEKLTEAWRDYESYGDVGKRALCLEDRFYLVTCALHRPDAFNAWLYQRCREIEAKPDGCLDLWAREHYKSTFITFGGSIQEILRDPEITICVFSHTAPDAKKFVNQIKSELETNRELQALFSDVLWDAPASQAPLWSVEKGITVKRKSNPREATLEGHGVVDSQPVGSHYRLTIYDDLVTALSVSTPEQVKKTSTMYHLADSLGARGEDGEKRKQVVGTRYSYADSYQELIDKKLLTVRLYPATDTGLMDGKPVLLTEAAWAKEKLKPRPVVAAQMLQNPAAGNEALFNKDHLRFSDIRPSTLTVAIMCDPASSHKKGSDNTSIQVWGMDVARNRYLLDGYHHKMGLTERWIRIRDLYKAWSTAPGAQLVKVGYERFGMMDALEYFEQRMEIEGISFPITELAWPLEGPGSKYDRIQRLEPQFRNGKIILSAKLDKETRNQEMLRERGEAYRIYTPVRRVDHERVAYSLNKMLIDEYLFYPFSTHDDALDCASRWDDMEMRPPVVVDQKSLEPEVFQDGA